jgi:hypothetical protein
MAVAAVARHSPSRNLREIGRYAVILGERQQPAGRGLRLSGFRETASPAREMARDGIPRTFSGRLLEREPVECRPRVGDVLREVPRG